MVFHKWRNTPVDPVSTPGEVAVLEHHVSSDRAVACHHVDHAVRQPCRLENLHDDLGAVDLGVAGFHTTTLPMRAATRQVAGNGGEVEWRDAKTNPSKARYSNRFQMPSALQVARHGFAARSRR